MERDSSGRGRKAIDDIGGGGGGGGVDFGENQRQRDCGQKNEMRGEMRSRSRRALKRL